MTADPRANADIFCRMVRARSDEHAEAMVLLRGRLPGQMVAILRQELDSMVRVIYLLGQPRQEGDRLMAQAVEGERWTVATAKGKNRQITDKEMVDLADSLTGWTQSVYKFGCAFIHLSRLHDYNDSDPLARLPDAEREDVLRHMAYYHGSPVGPEVTFRDLVPYLPMVFDKVRSNLDSYVRDLASKYGISQGNAG